MSAEPSRGALEVASIHAVLAVHPIRAEAVAEAFRDRGGGTAGRIIAAARTAMRGLVAVAGAAAVADGFRMRLERSGLAVDFAHDCAW